MNDPIQIEKPSQKYEGIECVKLKNIEAKLSLRALIPFTKNSNIPNIKGNLLLSNQKHSIVC